MTEPAAERILGDGTFCHVAASTPGGPHVTPMVFSTADGTVWVTTSRGSAKARAWRNDPRVAGMVRLGAEAVAFTGTSTTFDLLDPATWVRSLAASPRITVAGARFTRKNARFFAGYAVDAGRVPFAWTPPGRVFAELAVERVAVLEGGTIVSRSDGWGDGVESIEAFRASRSGAPALGRLPADVRETLGERGEGALALGAPTGPVVLPVAWLVEGPAVYAVVRAEVLALSGCGATVPASLGLDRPSSWRASEMVGAMIRGSAEIALVGRLETGERSAARIARAAGLEPEGAAVVRVRPRSLVWWRGWSSGTVAA